jgi:peptidoglycan/LPS O-acetylase OafA/YrhL
MIAFFGIMPGALVLRFVLATTYPHWITAYVITFARMDTLALGGFIALLARDKGAIVRLAHWARPIMFACATTLLLITLYVGELHPWHLLTETIGLTLLAIFFGALLVALITLPETSPIVRFFNFSPLKILGKYSYAIYVFHLPLCFLVGKIFKPSDIIKIMGSELLGQGLFFLVVSATSFIAAVLSWHLFENQFLKLKRFFPR